MNYLPECIDILHGTSLGKGLEDVQVCSYVALGSQINPPKSHHLFEFVVMTFKIFSLGLIL